MNFFDLDPANVNRSNKNQITYTIAAQCASPARGVNMRSSGANSYGKQRCVESSNERNASRG